MVKSQTDAKTQEMCTHSGAKPNYRYCDKCGKHLGRSEKKLAKLQKAKTWDDVYKDLKTRVTLESVHGDKVEISETSCVVMTEAIKDMLKKEFGERWGHYVSSTRRFIIH